MLLELAFSTVLTVTAAQDLVGQTVPPGPSGLEAALSACISSKTDQASCDYSVVQYVSKATEVELGAGLPKFLVANKKIGMSGDQPEWKIVDAIDHPPIGASEYLSIGLCRLDGREDRSVLAIVRRTNATKPRINGISWAARLGVPAGKLSVVESSRVDCENEAYGL